MPNIFDYLIWRGDLSFNQSQFNAIDNLILARFSYFPLEQELWGKEEKITIREAYQKASQIGEIPEKKFLQIEDKQLFPALANSQRFGSLYITKYKNKVSLEEEKQFSAVTILLPDSTIYVAYRGTDNTLIGWKEDFNMSFSSNVPSQKDAVIYLEEVAKQYKAKIRVGGHSKGGNLAIYAAIFSPEKIKKRIINAYNNDGPGFSKEIIQTKQYKEILDKIYTYVPQSSVIGRLLYHEEKYMVIKSTQSGLMQHDLYSWQVEGNDFIYLDEVTNGSQFADKMIKEWLNGVKPEQRSEFIDILFNILNSTDAQTLSELSSNWLKSARLLVKAYTTTDEESKKIITQTLSAILTITKDSILSTIKKPNKEESKKLVVKEVKLLKE